MKDGVKSLAILIIGLFVAIFLYPFIHELGHTFAALIFGYKVTAFQLLPLPSIACEMDINNRFAIIVVGFGGMLFPYIISIFPLRKSFWIWYFWLVLSGICLLSFAIGILGILLYKMGFPINNEDLTQIFMFSDKNYMLYFVMLVILSVLRVIQMLHTKPIDRFLKEFGV